MKLVLEGICDPELYEISVSESRCLEDVAHFTVRKRTLGGTPEVWTSVEFDLPWPLIKRLCDALGTYATWRVSP